ncbi:ATP-dependent acyl-CoA ligase [Pseudomaricurvus alkylphenolicus]|uniref:AMP-binding protein n=1 Tax=Pseudomaricurvus alkylphenolicus TaxID=1306991 RepID=UPI001420D26F|nr:AMP-binding protein [Pseudomaricurvus alkylphenolicus]NIB40442.1 ATP-dependent acyl-CoA ligase [Pseudomaricurvus alkylphenolicus]
MPSVYEAFRDSVSLCPSNPFIHIPAAACAQYHDGPIELTYAEAGDQVEQLQLHYGSAGYGIGHRVGLLLENRVEFFLHWIALNALGVSVVPVNGEMTAEEKAYLLGHSESCLVITLPHRLQDLEATNLLLPEALPLVPITDLTSLPAVTTPASKGRPSDDTECALLYTSGSTGKPKGCVLTNDYFLTSGRWYAELGGLCALETGKERLLTPLPVVHMNAMACSTMVMILTGGCIVQLDRFHPKSWWKTVRDSGATVVHYLGVMPAILLNMDADTSDTQHAIKFGFGAGVNPTHHAAFEDRFNFPLIEAWAMTESGCAGAIIANHEPRHVGTSCIGKPSAAIEVKLVDEQGEEVVFGEPGELLVRAAGDNPRKGFFVEYLKNPEATAETWAGDWLHTGDVVRFGEDGQLHFVDRRKNVIRRSGENISALEVEAALSTHPAIDQVAVAPVPDEIRGDEVTACIVLADGFAADENTARDIYDHCFEALVYFKTPGYIAFVDALPLTPSQKPQRGELKTLCRELVQAQNCLDLRDWKKRSYVPGASITAAEAKAG